MSPALVRRRPLLELLAGAELAAITGERFLVQVPQQAAYAQAVRRLQQWQQQLHETTCRAWLGLAGGEE